MTTSTDAAALDARPAAGALYRAVWRWHFYAGLLVLPFMILLAVTGGLYLYKKEINALFYADYLTVPARATAPLPASAILAAAGQRQTAPASAYFPSSRPTESASVVFKTPEGKQRVYVDPYDGRILGQLADGGFAQSPFMLLVRRIHSLKAVGWAAERVIEIVAGWSIILVITGVYLWWPRQQSGGVLTIRPGVNRRVFWRDLHAVTGIVTAVFLVFLAVTGLPWSGYWGKKVQTIANEQGWGYPPQYWDNVPKSKITMQEGMTHAAWSLEVAPMPASTPKATPAIGIDKAIAIFEQRGVAKGYGVDLPKGPEGVYSASVYPDQIAGERIIHLDQYTGAALFDGGFQDLGPVGKAIEWGVSVHMGQEFGRLNQLLMTLACLAIVVLAVSAIVMWRKRRPAGRLGAPALPQDWRVPRTILGVAAVTGVAFPLVGLSLLLALAIDLALPPAVKRFA